ncbi:hypothetical protein [Nocardioides pelophilus]|uniref:hypothetical protein n=1 Tax=Nocardioides pelophilus TaxID=2172019 RepID=UPI001601A8D8|nr:hypothetical protein [Nocardioides pelophilus]
MTARRSRRSYAPLTREHLDRLSAIALADHQFFTRADGRPEFADRRVAVVLAQGGALHYLHGDVGIKDLDVWTFYAAVPGVGFPAKRNRHVDFGPSALGRQRYDHHAAKNPAELARFHRWEQFQGRRVDLLMRDLPIEPTASLPAVRTALRSWLEAGEASTSRRPPSSYYLAQKAMILIDPRRRRGTTVWPVGI